LPKIRSVCGKVRVEKPTLRNVNGLIHNTWLDLVKGDPAFEVKTNHLETFFGNTFTPNNNSEVVSGIFLQCQKQCSFHEHVCIKGQGFHPCCSITSLVFLLMRTCTNVKKKSKKNGPSEVAQMITNHFSRPSICQRASITRQ